MIFINGQSSDCLDPRDRAVQYGDGVFRTLLVRQGAAWLWARHYAKLAADCLALGLDCPDEAVLAEEVWRLSGQGDGVVKILISRGVGGRGYRCPERSESTRMVMWSPLPTYPSEWHTQGIRAHECATRLAIQPRLAGIKHLNRLENVLARSEWSDPVLAEGVLRDMEGYPVEGTMTNLFFHDGAGWVTPALDRCGVAGVMRDHIMALMSGWGEKVTVRRVEWDELLAAQEIFLCNSVVGVWPVVRLAHRTWPVGPATKRLCAGLDSENV